MKTTGRCPKCGSADLLAVEPGLYNSFPIGFFVNAKIQRYVCRTCGDPDELSAAESMAKLRQSTWHDEK